MVGRVSGVFDQIIVNGFIKTEIAAALGGIEEEMEVDTESTDSEEEEDPLNSMNDNKMPLTTPTLS